jgi:hypothetical protein
MRISVLLSALLVACCTREPLPPEPPIVEVDVDAGAAGPFVRACANLRRLGCPEAETNAAGRSCAQVMMRAGYITVVPTECISSGASVAEVRACGSSNTLRIRCQP